MESAKSLSKSELSKPVKIFRASKDFNSKTLKFEKKGHDKKFGEYKLMHIKKNSEVTIINF